MPEDPAFFTLCSVYRHSSATHFLQRWKRFPKNSSRTASTQNFAKWWVITVASTLFHWRKPVQNLPFESFFELWLLNTTKLYYFCLFKTLLFSPLKASESRSKELWRERERVKLNKLPQSNQQPEIVSSSRSNENEEKLNFVAKYYSSTTCLRKREINS